MTTDAYAKHHAQEVFKTALDKKELNRWQSDLRKIASLTEDATLKAFFESPKIHFESKARLLSERLGDINPLALNLTYLLVTKGRLDVAGDIADDYQQLLDAYHGIEHAEVTTAVPLDEEDKLKLGERLSAIVGKKIVLKPNVDASIIGGIIARVGDKLIDGSTRSRLIALKHELARVRR